MGSASPVRKGLRALKMEASLLITVIIVGKLSETPGEKRKKLVVIVLSLSLSLSSFVYYFFPFFEYIFF